jgi:hypothetical protein
MVQQEGWGVPHTALARSAPASWRGEDAQLTVPSTNDQVAVIG